MEPERTTNAAQRRSRRGSARKRTGCATCKARHTRCDEKTPVCSNCERLGLQCRPSELITQSTWSSILSTESASGNEITSASTPNKILALPCPAAARETSKGSSSESSSSLTTGNRGSATGQSCRSQLRPFPSGIFVELNDEIAFLLNTFRGGLATWMDVFDHDRTYGREVTRRALHSNFLLRCICAFTARHLSMLVSGELWFPIASRYYGEALNYMIAALNSRVPDSDALTAAILLSSYEALAASRTSHQSHYKGAVNLIVTQGISASSMGMDRANFFIYVRHEITIAISNEAPPQFDPGRWNITKPGPSAAEDRVANYLMLLIGHIVNLIYQNNVSPVDRERLKIQVDEWYDSTTEEFRGIEYGDVSENGMPKIFFPVPLSAGAMLWFHAAQLLLLVGWEELGGSGSSNEPLVNKHAMSIITIASSELPACVRCFAVTPIYLGKPVDSSKRLHKISAHANKFKRENILRMFRAECVAIYC